MTTPYTCFEDSQSSLVMKSVALLNRKLTEKGLVERFSFEDSLLFNKKNVDDGDYFHRGPIIRFSQAYKEVRHEQIQLGKNHYITATNLTTRKRYYSLQFLLEVIDTVRVAKDSTDDPDEYHYPIRLSFNNESCVIMNQKQWQNFQEPKYDKMIVPFYPESLAKCTIQEKIIL